MDHLGYFMKIQVIMEGVQVESEAAFLTIFQVRLMLLVRGPPLGWKGATLPDRMSYYYHQFHFNNEKETAAYRIHDLLGVTGQKKQAVLRSELRPVGSRA